MAIESETVSACFASSQQVVAAQVPLAGHHLPEKIIIIIVMIIIVFVIIVTISIFPAGGRCPTAHG